MADALTVTATYRGGYQADVEARSHRVSVDEPAEYGGNDTGVMPTELFVASLASCFCLAVGHVARKRQLDVHGLRVTVQAFRAERELRYERLLVTIDGPLPQDELDALWRRARPFCWVSNTLAAGVAIEYGVTLRHAHPPE